LIRLLKGIEMGLFKKKTHMRIALNDQICLLKAYKVMQQHEALDAKTCFDVLLDVFFSNGHTEFEVMGTSAAGKTVSFMRLRPFHAFLQKEDAEELGVYFDEDYDLGIDYLNMPLNPENEEDEKRFVEYILAVPYEWYRFEQVKSIVTKIDAAIGLSYAYVCFVPVDSCIDAEEPVRKSGNTKQQFNELHQEDGKTAEKLEQAIEEAITQKRNMLRDVDSGHIPKQHPVNFYNNEQLKNLTAGRSERVSNSLTVVTYRE